MVNLDSAFLRAEACISKVKEVKRPSVLPSKEGDVRLERIRASWEAMGGTDEL